MKKILLLAAPFIFFTAQADTVTQQEADGIVLERLSQETRPYTIYAKEDVQQEMTITSFLDEVLEVNYKSWIYYIYYYTYDIIYDSLYINNARQYIIVNESNGNLLEVNPKGYGDSSPSDWYEWRIVVKEENIKLTENMLYVKTEFGWCKAKDLVDDSGIGNPVTIITISEDTVNVFVAFVYAAKLAPFETQVKIIDDVMYMYIIDACDAIFDDNIQDCYPSRGSICSTFDFVFKYQGEINQKYKILLIDPRQEEPYIISEGIINLENR